MEKKIHRRKNPRTWQLKLSYLKNKSLRTVVLVPQLKGPKSWSRKHAVMCSDGPREPSILCRYCTVTRKLRIFAAGSSLQRFLHPSTAHQLNNSIASLRPAISPITDAPGAYPRGGIGEGVSHNAMSPARA